MATSGIAEPARAAQLLLLLLALTCLSGWTGACGLRFAVNSWYVRFAKPTPVTEAREVARRRGFSCAGSLLGSTDEYHFQHKAFPLILTQGSAFHTWYLKQEPSVALAVQEIGRLRVKRGHPSALRRRRSDVSDGAARLRSSAPESAVDSSAVGDDGRRPTDPLFDSQWHLRNSGQAGGTVGLDLNVEAAWAKGFTGHNVTVAILDDGVDYLHPDLWENYHSEASYDYSSDDPFPYPRYTDSGFNSHGTRCAGEVAASRNGKQAIGVAYDSRIAGLRILDQPFMTDIIESKALGHMQSTIDIYSASWGPSDEGYTVDGPRELAQRALVHGINEGRQRKGNIYVWASGDGGPHDNCNCDGYAASMWTISINSVTNNGERATYSESCSSTLASAFSNGRIDNKDSGVVTIDLYGETTFQHSGTSAAAPQAAGVFALTLQANPNLTWRDLQHLVVLTSRRSFLHDPHGAYAWKTNGAGLEFNHLFGFGVLDAGDMVDLAHAWKTVPERFHCSIASNHTQRNFTSMSSLRISIDTDACDDELNEVHFLEHVQAVISVKADRRGDIAMSLVSPMNTRSNLLTKRPIDEDSVEGFNRWPFMTTQCWGENPKGRWVLEVTLDSDDLQPMSGALEEVTLVLHGTKEPPYLGQAGGKKHPKLAAVRRRHASVKFKKDPSRKRYRETTDSGF